jgi:hypothetical protein
LSYLAGSERKRGKMKTAVKVTTEGIVSVIDLQAESNELATLQSAVGGLIEVATLQSGYTMFMNEEGKIHELPINEKATKIWLANFPNFPDVILGDIVLAGATDEEGEQLGLDPDYAKHLVELLA